MKIKARVENSKADHLAAVATNGGERLISIPAKTEGPGSAVNGGELLCLALATCCCNDIYREAAKRGIAVDRVEVEVSAEFGAEGEPARNITYSVNVEADAPETAIRELIAHTDTVAEIQNTLRNSTRVELVDR